jgi:hypothetical protein
MQPKLKRLIIGATALAVAAGGLLVTNNPAQAAPGDPAEGPVTLPATTTPLTTVFSMSPSPAPGICDGNSSTGGYRWQTFITPLAVNPGTLTYSAAGPAAPAGSTGFTSGLLDNAGNFIIQRNTSAAATITPIPGFNLSALGAGLTPGAYNIGFACSLAGVTTNFWTSPITVTATDFTQGVFLLPGAPVLGAVTYNPAGTTRPTTATVNFTHAASTPATTGYTATLTPVGGAPAIAPIAVAAGATSFEIPGLDAGETYSVTLTATNSVGTSAPSAAISVTGDVQTSPVAVTTLSVFDGDDVIVNWTAPAGPVAPASYDVAILQGATVVASQNAVAALTATFPGLAVGTYTARVTPNYAAGSGVSGQAGTASFSVNPGALVFQELTVTRPEGALILTQRCGTYNAMPTVSAGSAEVPNDFPGFPFNLDPAPAVGQYGTAPILVDGSNNPIDGDPVAPGVQTVLDPEFGNYPLPNDDPADGLDVPFGNVTQCGLDMGVAQFVTEFNSPRPGLVPAPLSPLAGEFFAADGRLNEVTVLDTRDLDTGWKLKADIEDRFTSISNGDSFSGDYLGVIPQMTDDSDVVGGEGPNGSATLYDQTVVTGLPGTVGARANGVVLPGDGFPDAAGFNSGDIGLTDNPVLASAAPNAGLGIATIDARLLLLIPASVDAADYSATLTLTVAP